MKRLFKIAVVLVILIGFVSCHKYPEDPSTSFIRPIKRLSNASSWNMVAYYINGISSMDSLMHKYVSVNPLLSTSSELDFAVMGTAANGGKTIGINFISEIGAGDFLLEDNKNKLKIYIPLLCQGYYNPFINTTSDWDIEELTSNKLDIKSMINGINYEITFVAGN